MRTLPRAWRTDELETYPTAGWGPGLPPKKRAVNECAISADAEHFFMDDGDHALRYRPAVSAAAQQPDTDHVLPDFEPYRAF
jgi:hypothetical protein